MVRKGSELHKVQQKISREAYCADGYLTAMEGFISKYDDTCQRTESVSNMLACIIFEMGWRGDYARFCEKEKILFQQDPA